MAAAQTAFAQSAPKPCPRAPGVTSALLPELPPGYCELGVRTRSSSPSTVAWNFSHGASRSL